MVANTLALYAFDRSFTQSSQDKAVDLHILAARNYVGRYHEHFEAFRIILTNFLRLITGGWDRRGVDPKVVNRLVTGPHRPNH